jgi:hypothetical protein
VTLFLSLAIGAFLIGAATAQAATAAGPVPSHTNAVRAVQPAVSGLFQLQSPRVWADGLDEAGLQGANGVPDFLETWQAFRGREDSAILKNAYAFRTTDDQGQAILYAGLQRASSGGPSKVVFEFSQKPGERLFGDLLIDAEIDGAGNVGTVRFQSYSAEKGSGKLIQLALLSGEGCSEAGTACIVTNGALLEVGVNLSQLLSDSGFKAIKITTPEDSVVGTFSLAGVSDGCVSEISGFKAGCTANDIQLTAIVPGSLSTKFCSNATNTACGTNADCVSPGTCTVSGNNCTGDPESPGTVKFSATGRFVLTTQTRYDVGLFIDTAGDPEDPFKTSPVVVPDAARSGQCTRFAFSNTDGVNAETPADTCGDLTQAIAAAPAGRAMPFGPVTIQCVDKDDDGLVDVYHCETWSQNEDEINCQSSTDVKAGTSSKCNCGLLAGACIPFPNDDECLENVCVLRCSGDTSISCTIGGTQCTGKGFCQDTLITQNKANGTACGDQSSGACKDPNTCQEGVCTTGFKSSTTPCGDAAGQCETGASCTGDSVTCPAKGFKSATTPCVGTSNGGVCDGDDSCNASGVCVDVFKGTETTCRISGGCCDPPEVCSGTSSTCPDDVLFGPETTCRPSDTSKCDAPEVCDGVNATCPADACASTPNPADLTCVGP